MTTFGSVCSGIEAASVAWEPLGWRAAWLSEIDRFPSAVLAHHWPEVPNLGDMADIPGLLTFGLAQAPDVFVGGTPCQSFSVAGLRDGLSDERGNLTLTYVEILNAIDRERTKTNQAPAVAIWENVPGVLSSKDNAFGCFLAGLVGETEPLLPTGPRWPNAGCVVGGDRTAAWRVLDAQHFGVPQRRRRVFVVASAREGFDPLAVLFEPDCVQRPLEPRPKYRPTENTGASSIRAYDMLGFGQYGSGLTASTCKARDYKDATDLVVMPDGRVRRLMPVECERLQGFPDNHTRIEWRNKPADLCPDGPRYKAIGNSMAVPVMRWLGERIEAAIGTTNEDLGL